MKLDGQEPTPLSDSGKLASALASPVNQALYGDADLFLQAAFPMGRVATAHGYVDGNKRTAVALTIMFLENNGYYFEPSPTGEQDDDIENLLLEIVTANTKGLDPELMFHSLRDEIAARVTPMQG